VLEPLASCFSRPSFENFRALITGWILCQGRHCLSRVIQGAATPRAAHFSTLYRFFSRARWSPDAVAAAWFRLFLPFLPEVVEAIVDDTLCRHGGPRIFGIAMHHDGARSNYGKGTSVGRRPIFSCGHCWVVVAVRVPLPWDRQRGIAVPMLLRLYRSKKRCDPRSYHKRTELAAQMIELLASWIPPQRRLSVVGDGEYACRTLVRRLRDGVTFIGPAVLDAALFEPAGAYRGKGRPRVKGARLPSPRAMLARAEGRWRKLVVHIHGRTVGVCIREQVALWYTVAGTRLVRVVVTRDPRGRWADRAFFSTDPSLPARDILERFARRWMLEVTFRDAKQHLGLGHPQNGWSRGPRAGTKTFPGPRPRGTRGSEAVLRTVPFAFSAYAAVVLWYLRVGQADDAVRRSRRWAPWYRHKLAPSFRDMLVAVRRHLWTTRLLAHPGQRLPSRELERILPDPLLAA